MVSPYELVVELAESHTVTPQTEGPTPISTTSRDTYLPSAMKSYQRTSLSLATGRRAARVGGPALGSAYQ